ncbi:MAG: PfkB family carbohydrate kinase [Paracoccus sp. (in: a-proteobacteria)]|nr:PfkB family carbohydrate kinase [Paracoccus sp. (in: a-proteobacteria)]
MNGMSAKTPDILCIGAALWDVIGRTGRVMGKGHDVPGRIAHIPGGVALNAAIAFARRGWRPAILSAVGRDAEGEALLAASEALGVDCRFVAREGGLPTDVYMAIEDKAGLIAAIADVHSLEAAGAAILAPLRDGRLPAPWTGPVVTDGNLTAAQLAALGDDPAFVQADLRIVPASPGKAERLLPLARRAGSCFYLNRIEAEILAGRDFNDAAEAAQGMLGLGMARVLVTDGAASVAEAAQGEEAVTARPPEVEIVRVTGAGDCFLAAHITAERAGMDRAAALTAAASAAAAHVSGKDLP